MTRELCEHLPELIECERCGGRGANTVALGALDERLTNAIRHYDWARTKQVRYLEGLLRDHLNCTVHSTTILQPARRSWWRRIWERVRRTRTQEEG